MKQIEIDQSSSHVKYADEPMIQESSSFKVSCQNQGYNVLLSQRERINSIIEEEGCPFVWSSGHFLMTGRCRTSK